MITDFIVTLYQSKHCLFSLFCIIQIKYLNPVYLLMEDALRRGISLIPFGRRAILKLPPNSTVQT